MRAHVIKDGKIINTIIVDSLDSFPDLVDADLVGGGIGDGYDGKRVISQEPVIKEPSPEEIAAKEKAEQKAALTAEIRSDLESTETKTIAALKAIILKLLDVLKG
jgi:hypothetical protein